MAALSIREWTTRYANDFGFAPLNTVVPWKRRYAPS